MTKILLPVIIPKATPDQWRGIESKLISIAEKEKDLEPRYRVANNSLALARSYAKRQQWGDLFRFLIDRELITIETVVAAPPPKEPKPPKPRAPRLKPEPFGNTIKQKLRKLLGDILYSDRAISLATVRRKSAELGCEMHPRLYRDYMAIFCDKGLIHKHPQSSTKYVYYSLEPTDKIDINEWLPAKLIYPIAVANGYPHTLKALVNIPIRRRNRAEIAAIFAGYGIEYNVDHSPLCVTNWRVKQ